MKLIKHVTFFWLLSCSAWAVELTTSAQDLYPKFFLDESGKMKGLLIDIMQAIEKDIPNLKFVGLRGKNIEFDLWERSQKLLEHQKMDALFGIAKSEKRTNKGYIFIETPLYTLNNIFAVRKDDDIQINSLEDVEKLGKNGVILAIPGTASLRFIKNQNYNLLIDSSSEMMMQNFIKLFSGRGRLLFSHDLGILSTIKRGGYKEKIKPLPMIFKSYTHHVAFSNRVDEKIVKKIASSLEKLSQNGELTKIYKEYTE